MKININPGERSKLNIRIPTVIALNPLTALFLCIKSRKNGTPVNYFKAVAFLRELRRYRREHPEWALVEITEDGKSILEVRI